MSTPLYLEVDLIVSTVAGSTSHRAAESAAFMRRALLAWQARAEGGARNSRNHSASKRARIRDAMGTLRGPSALKWTLQRLDENPAKWGFTEDDLPSEELVREVVREALAQIDPVSVVGALPSSASDVHPARVGIRATRSTT